MNEEEEESLKKIQEITSNTFKLLKRNLVNEFGKEKYGLCGTKFTDCLNTIEELFVKFVGQIGETCLNINNKMTCVNSIVQQLKIKTKSLQDQLFGTRLLLEEKNSQIVALQEINSNLLQTVEALQVEISAGAEIAEEYSENSLEGVNYEDIAEYESNKSEEVEEEEENSDDKL